MVGKTEPQKHKQAHKTVSGTALILSLSHHVSVFVSPSFSRIYEILPQRIQQWQQSPCVAEEMGRRQLERIRKEQQAARLRLTLMEKRFHELEGIIANAKQQQVQQHEEVRDSGTVSFWFDSSVFSDPSDFVFLCLFVCLSLFFCPSLSVRLSVPVCLSVC